MKQLVEDEETGAKSYRYVRTGTNHYSLAFTYDCIAWSRDTYGGQPAIVASSREPWTPDLMTMRF